MASAVRLLSIVPLPGTEGSGAVAYFSWVGWLFAALAAVIVGICLALGAVHGLGALLVAALVVAAWGLLSGFMHWDGLADSADGAGVRGDAERRLAVMRDSTIGAFGVVAIALTCLLQVAALSVAVENSIWWALSAPVLGRWVAAIALWTGRPARQDGLGARYSGKISAGSVVVLSLALLPLLLPWPPSPVRLLLVAGALAVGLLLARSFSRRIGGITGDVLGAVIVLTETAFLVGVALLGRLG